MISRRKTKQQKLNNKKKQSNQTVDVNGFAASHQTLPIPMPTLGVSDGLMRRGDLYVRNF